MEDTTDNHCSKYFTYMYQFKNHKSYEEDAIIIPILQIGDKDTER